jgi:tetratricopeptide (TPR) repeat protein
MATLGPIHVVDAGTFTALTASSLATDIAALAILAAGAVLARRRIFAGIALLIVAAALLPVLHLLPYAFGDSLYHERYAMNALALAIILAPRALLGVHASAREHAGSRSRRGLTATAAVAVWLLLAIANVRATIPLWSNDVLLWEWALARNPDSIEAKDHLLTAYMVDNDIRRARELAASIVSSGTRCPSCLLNAASLALDEQDAAHAEEILETLKHDEVFEYDAELFHKYILVVGRLLELKGDLAGAESAYREAMRMQPLDPKSRSLLAWILLREGNVEQARDMMQTALERFAPDIRERYRIEFERQVGAAQKPTR